MEGTVQVWFRAESAKGPQYWRNTWEIDLGIGGFWANNLETVAQAFATFHKAFLLPVYTIDHIVVSTIAEDGEPYNPDTFSVTPINQAGTRTLPSGEYALPLTNVLHVRKTVVRGRPGRLMLRGALGTSDIQSDGSGVVRLADAPGLESGIDGKFGELLTSLGAVVPCLVGSGLAATPRPVVAMNIAGLSYNPARRAVKPKVPTTSPFAQMAEIVGGLQGAAELMNPIITAFNALPLPDVPLLPE